MGVPKLAIIVPVYKVPNTLYRCLDSIFSEQEALTEEVEVLAVNDASPDNCGELLAAYQRQQPRLRVITHKINKREAGAHNTGVANTTAEYFLRLDSDDAFRLGAIKSILKVINDCHPDIIMHGFDCVNGDGEFLSQTIHSNPGLYRVDSQNPKDLRILFEDVAFCLTTPNVVYRRAAAPEVRHDPRFIVSGDTYYGWQYFRKAQTVYVLGASIVNYYQYDTSLSHSVSDQAAKGLMELDQCYWREVCSEPRFASGLPYAFRRLLRILTSWHYHVVFDSGAEKNKLAGEYFNALGLLTNNATAHEVMPLGSRIFTLASVMESRMLLDFQLKVVMRCINKVRRILGFDSARCM